MSYGKATPYFPVIDVLKRYSHVEECDDSRTIRAEVTGQVLTLDPALQDTIPVLLSLRQGAVPRALPLLERAVGLCQEVDLSVYFPLMAPALGAAIELYRAMEMSF